MIENYDSYIKNKKDKGKVSFKIFDKIRPVHIILFAVLFYVGTLISKGSNGKWTYILLAGMVILYLFSIVKQGTERNAIPRSVAQEIAKQDLIQEIKIGNSYIQGTEVTPTSYFKDQSWDAGEGPKLFKYNIGFIIKEPGYPQKEIVYQMNPFTGDCKGIVEHPLGFWGQEIKDVQMIFPEKIIKEEKS